MNAVNSRSDSRRDSRCLPARANMIGVVVLLVALYTWSTVGTGANPVALVMGIPDMADLFRRMWPPDLGYLRTMVDPLLETIQMALLGTVIGAIVAVPASFASARNVTRMRVVLAISKGFLNFMRTLPELLLASVFAAAVGFGALPGVLALSVFSFGIIAKLTSETIEAIDPGPLEALSAVGSPRASVLMYGVVPQVLPQFVAYCLYVFEINIRAATVLGLVGAGGIGMWLMRDMNLLMYRRASAIILLIFALVIAIDTVSNWLRGRLV